MVFLLPARPRLGLVVLPFLRRHFQHAQLRAASRFRQSRPAARRRSTQPETLGDQGQRIPPGKEPPRSAIGEGLRGQRSTSEEVFGGAEPQALRA